MPGFTITRGLGPKATPSAFIARGFFPTAVTTAARIIRGGRSQVSRAVKDLGYNFKISAMLIGANGKQFIDPIISVVRKQFNDEEIPVVKVYPKKLIARKSEDIKVKVTRVNVRKNK